MIRFNEWWKTGRVNPRLTGRRRAVFYEIAPYLNKRQIVLLYGMRRTGKTTLMFQMIDNLLVENDIEPLRILYFSFDEKIESINEIVEKYKTEVLKKRVPGEKIYFFFDEVQKLTDWQDQIKILYDLEPDTKIILSGSSALFLGKGASESLAGRFFKFKITPLTFDEYLEFENTKIDPTREVVYRVEIKKLLHGYIKTGGFPEAVDFSEDEILLFKYIKESILDRIVFIDIPELFGVKKRDVLYHILRMFSERPGYYLKYSEMGNDINLDQRTVESYIEYLEYSLMITKLFSFSKSFITSRKKIKRAYLNNTAFTYVLNPDIEFSLLLEQFFVNMFEAKFFWRNRSGKEVDIVFEKKSHVLPIEVKYKKRINNADLAPLMYFMKSYNLTKGLIITNENEKRTVKKEPCVIEMIPYWMYWSINQATTGVASQHLT